MNKVLGISILAMALVIGIVPLFTDCLSQGRTMTLANGMTAPMKCHWTAIAVIGVAVPLALVGILTAVNRRKGTLGVLSVFGLALGGLAILFPTALIGVCPNPMMLCNMVMKPTLITSGIVTMAASAGLLATSLPALRALVQLQGAAA
jgi:hypothetical protein